MKNKQVKPQHDIVGIPLVHARAAGIDVGDTLHSVAIQEGLFAERVKPLGSMTWELEVIALWLMVAKSTTAVLKSTGV